MQQKLTLAVQALVCKRRDKVFAKTFHFSALQNCLQDLIKKKKKKRKKWKNEAKWLLISVVCLLVSVFLLFFFFFFFSCLRKNQREDFSFLSFFYPFFFFSYFVTISEQIPHRVEIISFILSHVRREMASEYNVMEKVCKKSLHNILLTSLAYLFSIFLSLFWGGFFFRFTY